MMRMRWRIIQKAVKPDVNNRFNNSGDKDASKSTNFRTKFSLRNAYQRIIQEKFFNHFPGPLHLIPNGLLLMTPSTGNHIVQAIL